MRRCRCELNVNTVLLFDFRDIVHTTLRDAGSLCHVLPSLEAYLLVLLNNSGSFGHVIAQERMPL